MAHGEYYPEEVLVEKVQAGVTAVRPELTTAARMAARMPQVEPLTRYQVRFAPHRAAVRAMASAKMPSASCRSSTPGTSVISHPAGRPGAGTTRRLCPGMCKG